MQVKDVMSKNVIYVNGDIPIQDAADIMRESNLGILPVANEDRLEGVITDRDITTRAVADGKPIDKTTANDCMSKGISFCYEDDDTETLALKMANTRYRRLIVLNREKALVGIVSIGDLAKNENDKSKTQYALKSICE